MDSADTVALALAAEIPVVLQRVPLGTTATGFAKRLAEASGADTVVVDSPLSKAPGKVRVMDGRSWKQGTFATWEGIREHLAPADSPLVVLLDVTSGRQILQEAPHVASWAGGVRLATEPTVRWADNPAELKMGRNALARVLKEDPAILDKWSGYTVGVMIGSDRLFTPLSDTDALQRARAEVDEGIIYLWRLGDREYDDDE